MQPLLAKYGRNSRAAILLAGFGSVLLLGATRTHPFQPDELTTVAARAFVITDPETLSPFTLDRVMGAVLPDPLLRQRYWAESIFPDDGRHRPIITPLSGFIQTPTDASWWLTSGNTRPDTRPLAIVNRFDLGAPRFDHCGETRLVFSRRTLGATKVHVAVEVALPNPDPDRGREGCAAIAVFWSRLGKLGSSSERRAQLETFLFRGWSTSSPALDRDGFRQRGRIRTIEVGPRRPRFQQFELRNPCRICMPTLEAVPLSNTPDATLFDASIADERGRAFRAAFINQIASLTVPDPNRISMTVNPEYSITDVTGLAPSFNYQLPFRRSLGTAPGRSFRDDIHDALRRAGSSLTPENVIARAETQNCVDATASLDRSVAVWFFHQHSTAGST